MPVRVQTEDFDVTAELAALGVRLGSASDLSALRRLRVGDVHLREAVTVRGSAPASSLIELARGSEEFVVLDESGALEGIIGARDLRIALVNREALPLLQVRDIARTGIRAIDRDLPLYTPANRPVYFGHLGEPIRQLFA